MMPFYPWLDRKSIFLLATAPDPLTTEFGTFPYTEPITVLFVLFMVFGAGVEFNLSMAGCYLF